MTDPAVRLRRFRALPGLLATAPTWLLVVAGTALVVLGVVLVTRPLASLALLAVYAGTSCILSGFAEFTREHLPTWLRTAIGTLWIGVGAVLIIWMGRSLEFLPVALAALLILGGLTDLPRLRTGTLSQRILVGGAVFAHLAVGLLALLWPDLASATVALLFGLRTSVFGLALLRRALAAVRGRSDPGRRAHRGPAWLVPGARIVAAVLLVAIPSLAWWASLELRAGTPVVDAFYSTPSSLPGGPGSLIRSDTWPGTPPAGAQVRRILYTTTDLHGEPAVASAIVVVPTRRASGPAPVVLWDHGTTGIARECAPSLMTDMFQIDGIPAVTQAVEAGWVLVATDYSGQGAEGDFPYLVGQGEARSTLDAMRAARGLDGLELSDRAVVWGHSQGGHAALWTGAIARSYAPDLRILGVAAVSPAADPRGLAERITSPAASSPVSTLAIAWVLIPYSNAYDDVDFDAQVAPQGRAIVREMAARCTSQPSLLVSVISALGIGSTHKVYVGDLTGGALGQRLDENKTLGPWGVPMLMAWGSKDEVIPPALQHRYVSDLCRSGVDLTSREYPGLSHMGIVTDGSPFLPLLVSWTTDRFAGAGAPASTC